VTGPDTPFLDGADRQGTVRQDSSSISDASLAALLAGVKPSLGSPPQLHPLAQTLAELTARPTRDELNGEAETLAAFRGQFAPFRGPLRAPGPAHRRRRRPRLPSLLLPVRAAVVAGAAVLSLGGLAAAAYTGAFPAPVQRLAHEIIDAPAPGVQPASRPSPISPVVTPTGTSPSHRPRLAPTPHGSSKPAARPTPRGPGKPSGQPAPRDSGRPSQPPAQHGTGKPGQLPTPPSTGGPSAHPAGAQDAPVRSEPSGHWAAAHSSGGQRSAARAGHGRHMKSLKVTERSM
jgi:hypothetical protein